MSLGFRLLACAICLVTLLGVHRPVESGPKISAYSSNFLPGMVLPSDLFVLPEGRHRIDRCVLRFAEKQFRQLGLPRRHLRHVRFSMRIPAIVEDAPGYLALSSGYTGITRGNQVFVLPPDFQKAPQLSQFRMDIEKAGFQALFANVFREKGEELFFHELVHTSQYAKGLDIVRYGSASLEGFAGNKGVHTGNAYEREANRLGHQLVERWRASRERVKCLARRSPSSDWRDGSTKIAFLF